MIASLQIRKGIARMRVALIALLIGCGAAGQAQTAAPAPTVDPLMQLMISQPAVNLGTNVTVRVEFDPPVVGVGQRSVYRVNITAVNDAIKWPEDIYAPLELGLKQSSRGQVMQPSGGALQPITTINHRAEPTAPGIFTIPEFKVKVAGRNLTVPAAQLEVLASPVTTNKPEARLIVELSETNAFSGQPLTVRVMLPSSGGNSIQALMQVQINGDGIMVDQASVRQRIQPLELAGRSGPVFIYEATVTPLVAGRLDLTAQGYTSGNQFSGGITIQGQAVISGGAPQYVLLDSDPVRLEVAPLPRANVLPGFTGGIGQFTLLPPRLATNVVRVGDEVKLVVTFALQGEQRRLNPPEPPATTNWQMFPAVAEGGVRPLSVGARVIGTLTYIYTMIPLTTAVRETPAIPFSYFDPELRKYVDLTIPALPIVVQEGTATLAAQALAQAAAARTNEARLQLSELAGRPGLAARSLRPAQLQSSFWLAQLVPLLAFSALWWWERQRRFNERHPDVRLRRRALRALRQERLLLRRLAGGNDGAAYVRSAVQALRIGSAPHFPATPRALVGGDVLSLLPDAERNGEMGAAVRGVFDAADAAQFGARPDRGAAGRGWQADLERVLDRLEEKLR